MAIRNSRGGSSGQRGVALMLVLFAVAMAMILSLSFLSAQSTTAGITANIKNQTQARFIAESAMQIAIREVKRNSSWRTAYSNGTWVTGQSLHGGTFSIAGQDGMYDEATDAVVGDGSLTDDPADIMTLTATGTYGGCQHICRSTVRSIASGSPNLIVYGENSNVLPQYRSWSGSAWSSAQAAPTITKFPRWVVARSCPNRSEVAAFFQNNQDDLLVQFYNGSTWSASTVLTTNVVTSGTRPFDVAYEQSSGKLLMVYRLGSDGKVHYRTWNGTTLTADATFTPTTTGDPKWLRLIPKPGGNEIVMLNLDNNNDISTAVWNGSAWTNSLTLETNAKVAANQCMDGAYLNGTAVVAWSQNSSNVFKYRTWNGTSWSAVANGPTLGSKEPQWVKMAGDGNSSVVLAGTVDGNNDIYVMTWDGSAWSSSTVVETNAVGNDRRCFDVGFENSTGKGMVVWGRAAVNGCFYRTYTSGTWNAIATGPTLGNKVSVAQITQGTSSGQLFLEVLNKSSGALQSSVWNGTSFTAAETLNADISGGNDTEAFMVASTGSITTSPSNVGNTTVFGTSTKSVDGIQIATPVTVSTGGTLSSITAYIDGPPPKLVRYAIYTDSGGEPGTLITQTSSVANSSNSMHWQSISTTGTTLAAGTYWLALCFEHSNMHYQNNASAGGKTRYKNNNAISNGFLNSWGVSNTSLTQSFNIYLTLAGTTGGSGGTGSGGYTYSAQWNETP